MVQYKWRTNYASFNAIKNTFKQQSMLINSKKCDGAIISVVHYLPPLRYVRASGYSGGKWLDIIDQGDMALAITM
jgi:hypothetical protein